MSIPTVFANIKLFEIFFLFMILISSLPYLIVWDCDAAVNTFITFNPSAPSVNG